MSHGQKSTYFIVTDLDQFQGAVEVYQHLLGRCYRWSTEQTKQEPPQRTK